MRYLVTARVKPNDSVAKPVKEGVNKEEADGIKKKFDEVGAKVSIS